MCSYRGGGRLKPAQSPPPTPNISGLTPDCPNRLPGSARTQQLVERSPEQGRGIILSILPLLPFRAQRSTPAKKTPLSRPNNDHLTLPGRLLNEKKEFVARLSVNKRSHLPTVLQLRQSLAISRAVTDSVLTMLRKCESEIHRLHGFLSVPALITSAQHLTWELLRTI